MACRNHNGLAATPTARWWSVKVSEPFDPPAWITDLFTSDEELDEFLDDIYESRRTDPAA